MPALPPAPVPAPAVLPVPGAFGSAVVPMGMLVAGTAEVLVGGDRVAFGFDESVPFCELAALAAWAGAAVASAIDDARTMALNVFDMGDPSDCCCGERMLNARGYHKPTGRRHS